MKLRMKATIQKKAATDEQICKDWFEKLEVPMGHIEIENGTVYLSAGGPMAMRKITDALKDSDLKPLSREEGDRSYKLSDFVEFVKKSQN